MRDVIVIGGGLGGLLSAIRLARSGLTVTLLEKQTYPFHRVCGEYISNEVLPYLTAAAPHLPFDTLPGIHRLRVTSVEGRNQVASPLGLGGFGISRYMLEEHLLYEAQRLGVDVRDGCPVSGVEFEGSRFKVRGRAGFLMRTPMVIGAFGKRSNLDRRLGRRFMDVPTPWMAVKYHIRAELPAGEIALHHFRGGYCGVSPIEDDKACLCYLTRHDNLKGDIKRMEGQVVRKNPYLENLFRNAHFLSEKPMVIGGVSFEPKQPVENHILMVGDAAGLIAPLCGNGMAMAVRSSHLACEQVEQFYAGALSREKLEKVYAREWREAFQRRLWVGRFLQKTLGSTMPLTPGLVGLLRRMPPVVSQLIRQTHGGVMPPMPSTPATPEVTPAGLSHSLAPTVPRPLSCSHQRAGRPHL